VEFSIHVYEIPKNEHVPKVLQMQAST